MVRDLRIEVLREGFVEDVEGGAHAEEEQAEWDREKRVGQDRAGGFLLLDTQWSTPHLAQFGTMEIRRAEYLRQLGRALKREASF